MTHATETRYIPEDLLKITDRPMPELVDGRVSYAGRQARVPPMPRVPRITVSRLIASSLAAAAVLYWANEAGWGWWRGSAFQELYLNSAPFRFWSRLAAASAAGALLLAPRLRDALAAVAAIALGLLLGSPIVWDTCTGGLFGVVLGAGAGLLTFRLIRRPIGDARTKPGPSRPASFPAAEMPEPLPVIR